MRRLLFLPLLAFFLIPNAAGAQRIGVGYTVVDDGGCEHTTHNVTAEYDQEESNFELRGAARLAPSGGDCRKDTFSYDVNLSVYPIQTDIVDFTLTVGANEQSTQAAYALADGMGMALARADGNALFQTNLPAGSAKTYTAAVGFSRELGFLRLSAGYNFIPTDWAMYDSGNTAHVGLSFELGSFSFDGSVDAGATNFGEATATYRLGLFGRFDAGIRADYRWGLDTVDNGAPSMQYVNNAPFIAAGPPRGDSLLVSFTLGYSL